MRKPYDEMSEKERDGFYKLMADVSRCMTRYPPPPGMAPSSILAIMCILIKTLDRPLLNCRLEFELDRENFLRDVVDVGRWFLEASGAFAPLEREEAAVLTSKIRMLGDPRFMKIVEGLTPLCLNADWL